MEVRARRMSVCVCACSHRLHVSRLIRVASRRRFPALAAALRHADSLDDINARRYAPGGPASPIRSAVPAVQPPVAAATPPGAHPQIPFGQAAADAGPSRGESANVQSPLSAIVAKAERFSEAQARLDLLLTTGKLKPTTHHSLMCELHRAAGFEEPPTP